MGHFVGKAPEKNGQNSCPPELRHHVEEGEGPVAENGNESLKTVREEELEFVGELIWVEMILGREEDKSENEEESQEHAHHDVKNFFTAKAIGKPCEKKSQKDSAGENGPNFNEGDRLSPRLGSRDDHGVFVSAQGVIVEGNEEEHEEHWEEFFEFPTVDRPEKGTPLSKF